MMLQSPKFNALLLGALFLLVIIACVSYASYRSSSTVKSAHPDNDTNTPLIIISLIVVLTFLLTVSSCVISFCAGNSHRNRGVHMMYQQSSEPSTADSEQRNPTAQLTRSAASSSVVTRATMADLTEADESILQELIEHGRQWLEKQRKSHLQRMATAREQVIIRAGALANSEVMAEALQSLA